MLFQESFYSKKPNVIFILADDLGYGDLGCTGNPIVQTPNIDKLYEESVRFTNFHVAPTCSPTRASLLTGHYPNSTGVWHTICGRSLLRKDEWTLAEAFKENGYQTGIFGKWHLGDNYPYRPQDRGFDVAIIHKGGGVGQTPDYWGNDYFRDVYFVNGQPKKFEGYCTDVWFDEALKFIYSNRNKPFFCYIATNAPHWPYNIEKKYFQLYKDKVPEDRARFYGMITKIDENLGKLRLKLKEWGLEDNTILIFMGDNGTSTGAMVNKEGFVIDGYNAGLRGIKGSPYEGGHKVPFFIYWPTGGLSKGKDIDKLSSSIDFMPTLIELCELHTSRDCNFHGKSLVPLLYSSCQDYQERVIVIDSQRIFKPVKWRQCVVMNDTWRLINGKELYNIKTDPEQRNDVALDYPDIVEFLRKKYEEWWNMVSQKFDEEIPISVGSDFEEETCLTAMDWRNEECNCPWHQGFIRQGMKSNGYWEIYVEKSGLYRIELRRWPKEKEYPLSYGFEGNDIEIEEEAISESVRYHYADGKALPLKWARLKVGDKEYSRKIREEDTKVVFEVPLNYGITHLQTWLTGDNDFEIGAYYVYVRYIK